MSRISTVLTVLIALQFWAAPSAWAKSSPALSLCLQALGGAAAEEGRWLTLEEGEAWNPGAGEKKIRVELENLQAQTTPVRLQGVAVWENEAVISGVRGLPRYKLAKELLNELKQDRLEAEEGLYLSAAEGHGDFPIHYNPMVGSFVSATRQEKTVYRFVVDGKATSIIGRDERSFDMDPLGVGDRLNKKWTIKGYVGAAGDVDGVEFRGKLSYGLDGIKRSVENYQAISEAWMESPNSPLSGDLELVQEEKVITRRLGLGIKLGDQYVGFLSVDQVQSDDMEEGQLLDIEMEVFSEDHVNELSEFKRRVEAAIKRIVDRYGGDSN